MLALQPTAERVEALGGVGRWLDGVHLRRDVRIHSLANRLQAEVGLDSGCAFLMVESLALEIIASGFRGRRVRERVRPPFLERTLALIHARFREPLTLAEMADEAGVHPAHLTRTFRRFEGRSIGEAVREAKVQWAAEQIVMTDTSLSQIAHEAGYADQSHMSRWILRQYGVTPGALRRRGQGSAGRV